jgi:hypothetical protein
MKRRKLIVLLCLVLLMVLMVLVARWGYWHGDSDAVRRVTFQRLLEAQQLYKTSPDSEVAAGLFIDSCLRFGSRFPTAAHKSISKELLREAWQRHGPSFLTAYDDSVVYGVTTERIAMASIGATRRTTRIDFFVDNPFIHDLTVGSASRESLEAQIKLLLELEDTPISELEGGGQSHSK